MIDWRLAGEQVKQLDASLLLGFMLLFFINFIDEAGSQDGLFNYG
jgi:hypothetical protein